MGLQEKENIEPVVKFIDSMEDKYEEKIKKEIQEKNNNEKWLEDWAKSKKVFNKNFYNEANEKVEKVMKELDKQECTEDEIEEMISRVNCFLLTRNDVPSSLSFLIGSIAWVFAILGGIFLALFSDTLKHCSLYEKKGLLNLVLYYLGSTVIFSVLMALVVWGISMLVNNIIQKMIFRQGVLNLLKEKLEKKKEQLRKGNKSE